MLVFPFVPYPPTDGGRIGFFNPIKYLSRRHELVVVSLAKYGDEAAAEALRSFCADVRIFRMPARAEAYRLIRSVFFDPPGAAAKYWHEAAGETIREAIAQHAPDIVEFHHLNTAVYRRFADGLPTVLREHNVEYKVWERYAENASGWSERSYAKWTAPRVARYEGKVALGFDRCVVVSPADAVHLRKAAPAARIEVIPSGVDTEYFRPMPDVAEQPWSLTLTGSFEWKPKQRSLRSLLTQVFPRIRAKLPEVKLNIVGKGVPAQLQQLAQKTPGVSIRGSVADVRPYIAQSALMIQYLESGGGIALKVLEAMAMRKPVLSNTLGCEGIEVTHGRDVFLADGVEEFAESAATLLKDRAQRMALAHRGFRRIAGSYSWDAIADRFEECYAKVVEDREARNRSREIARGQRVA